MDAIKWTDDVSSVIMDFGAKTVLGFALRAVIHSVKEKQDTVEIVIPDIFIMVQRVCNAQLGFMGIRAPCLVDRIVKTVFVTLKVVDALTVSMDISETIAIKTVQKNVWIFLAPLQQGIVHIARLDTMVSNVLDATGDTLEKGVKTHAVIANYKYVTMSMAHALSAKKVNMALYVTRRVRPNAQTGHAIRMGNVYPVEMEDMVYNVNYFVRP